MAQQHTWQLGSNPGQYTLTKGAYQAVVWQQTTGEWSAIISRGHMAVDTGTFKTLKTAQKWCETQIAKQRAITA